VDLVPEEVPKFFRSGMNAAVDFITENKERILLVPLEAVHKDQRGEYVFVVTPDRSEPVKTTVKTGAADDKNIEIVSGITKDDRIILGTMKYVLPKKSDKTNPFLPGRH
jgi:HlyD family secretion protein